MKKSESIKEISAALAKAQAEIRHSEKDGVNPHFRNEYSTLASVFDACKPALNKNGITVIQLPLHCDTGVIVETMFLHSSGEWISSELYLPVQGNAQQYGSALTYARRYSLAAMAGVAPADDDGNGAQLGEDKKLPEQKPPVQSKNPKKIEMTPEEYKKFFLSLPSDVQDFMRQFTQKGEALEFAKENGFDVKRMIGAIPRKDFAEEMKDSGMESVSDKDIRGIFGE